MHPGDVAARGLADGALARIGRDGRSVQARVAVSDTMMPGVVSLPHGWGHDLAGTRLAIAAERPGANLNAVLDDTLIDPLSGNAVLSGVAVEVAPA
ncbi:MAG: molybdopterin oxidoreductase family protein, partial [Burkholderiales bacterium]|nr:molybdopterin oxidoreductase family protein [Burkholderiales bacterium]